MELKTLCSRYREHSPQEWFDAMSRGGVMELRFLTDKDGNRCSDWEMIRYLAQDLPTRFSSIFVSTWSECKRVLMDPHVRKKWNVFISVNPKRKVAIKTRTNKIYQGYCGSMAGIDRIQNIFCDIEFKDRKGDATEDQIMACLEAAEKLCLAYGFTDYHVNVSGHGAHLLIHLDEPIVPPMPDYHETPDKIVYDNHGAEFRAYIDMYHKVVEDMDNVIQKIDNRLKVDEGAKDFSRICRPVGSWNVKIGKTPRQVGTYGRVCTGPNVGLKAKMLALKDTAKRKLEISREARKNLTEIAAVLYRYDKSNIRSCPLYQLLVSRELPSLLSRNHYLEASFARILRDSGLKVEDVRDVIAEIDAVQRKTTNMDYAWMTDKTPFNPETVNAWCYGSRLEYVYPIMGQTPDDKLAFITDEKLAVLEALDRKTVEALAVPIEVQRGSYSGLKEALREILREHDKTTAFCSMKAYFWDEWEYYQKHKLAQILLNKIRAPNHR